MNLFTVGILLSILYLYIISQYNLCTFNTVSTADNWFIHPSNGGVCIFGQFMALLTCILLFSILCFVRYTNKMYDLIIIILYLLSILWVFGSYFMNNSWLSFMCIPLAIVWICIAHYN